MQLHPVNGFKVSIPFNHWYISKEDNETCFFLKYITVKTRQNLPNVFMFIPRIHVFYFYDDSLTDVSIWEF